MTSCMVRLTSLLSLVAQTDTGVASARDPAIVGTASGLLALADPFSGATSSCQSPYVYDATYTIVHVASLARRYGFRNLMETRQASERKTTMQQPRFPDHW